MGLLTALKHLVASPPPADDAEQRFWDDLKPLGEFRWCVLACVGSFDRSLRQHFHPSEPSTLPESLRSYLDAYWAREQPSATGPQFNGLAIVAAGLLTFGRLEMADYILANMPPHRIKLDHGCGWCNVLAFRIAAALLPLPDELRAYMEWFEGSATADEVRSWYASHRAELRWNDAAERIELSEGYGGSA